MGDTILLRRGTAANLPDLQEGEPGFATDSEALYIGDSTGTAESASYIGGGVYVDALQYEPNTYTQATIEAALTAIGTTDKVTLLLRPGTWVISSNADWSAYTNVTFKIVPGALISHGAFTIDFANQPVTDGIYQYLTGTGTVTFAYPNEVYPEIFGTTEYGDLISKSIAAITLVGGEIVFTRAMGATTAVNCTMTSKPITFRGKAMAQGSGGTGFPDLKFTMSGGNAFDCTGAAYLLFENWTLSTDSTDYPDIGLLLARGVDGSTGAAGHKFINFKIDYNSKFTTAAMYNFAVEEIDFISCQFCNGKGGLTTSKAMMFTSTNSLGKSSAFTTIYASSSSMTAVNFYGGKYFNLSADATSDVFYFQGTSDIHWFGGFWYAHDCRSYVYLDQSGGATDFISIDGIRCEVGADPSYGILIISGVTPTGPVYLSVKNNRFDGSTKMIYADANTTLLNMTIDTYNASSQGVEFAGDVSKSTIINANSVNIAGTSTDNFIIGSVSSYTFGTRVRGVLYDSDTGSIIPFIQFGSLADSATPSVADRDIWATIGTTTITNLTGGREGEVKHIIAETTVTITDGTNIFLNGSANWTMNATDTLTLICRQSKWYELGRSDNT